MPNGFNASYLTIHELERMVYPMTEKQENTHWLQDNLRILVSIGIVILLVMAIYSYSKRNAPSRVVVDDVQQTEQSTSVATAPTDDVDTIISEITDEPEQTDAERQPAQDTPAAPAAPVTPETPAQEPAAQTPATPAPTETQPETRPTETPQQEEQPQSAQDVVKDIVATRNDDGTVSVTATRGDSVTTLARKAIAQYASAHNITDLSGAQKIYMEDYVRRTQAGVRVQPDTTIAFASAQIEAALTQARALTPAQITNLDRYARTVTNL